ncbi:MAG: hypothetical protein K6A41_04210 [Bacteroidales bacterium]|nr:hypothetical protein [Bacteroidales bacterium]
MTKQKAVMEKLLAEIAKEKRILKNQKGLYSIFSDYQYGGNRTDRMVKFVTGMIDGSSVSSVTEYLTALKMSIRITEREIGKLMVRYAMAKYVGKY